MLVWQFTTIAVLIGALLVYVMVLTNRLSTTNVLLKRIEEALVTPQSIGENISARILEEPTMEQPAIVQPTMVPPAAPAPAAEYVAPAAQQVAPAASAAVEVVDEPAPAPLASDRRVSFLTVRDLKVMSRSGRRTGDNGMPFNPFERRVSAAANVSRALAEPEPVIEEPVIQAAANEGSAAAESFVHEPLVEEAVSAAAVVREPFVAEAVDVATVVHEPVVEETVGITAVVHEPVFTEPFAGEATVQEPVVAQFVVPDAVIEESVVETPVVQAAVAEHDPVIELPPAGALESPQAEPSTVALVEELAAATTEIRDFLETHNPPACIAISQEVREESVVVLWAPPLPAPDIQQPTAGNEPVDTRHVEPVTTVVAMPAAATVAEISAGATVVEISAAAEARDDASTAPESRAGRDAEAELAERKRRDLMMMMQHRRRRHR